MWGVACICMFHLKQIMLFVASNVPLIMPAHSRCGCTCFKFGGSFKFAKGPNSETAFNWVAFSRVLLCIHVVLFPYPFELHIQKAWISYLSVRVYFAIVYVMKIWFLLYFPLFFSLGLNQLQAARGGKRGVNMNPSVLQVCVCFGGLLAVLVQVF